MRRVAVLMISIAFLIGFARGQTDRRVSPAAADPAFTVFATGLDSPRGLTFDSAGNLYVAEAGQGGNLTTTSQECQQVPVPVGPYRGGYSSTILEITPSGSRSVIAAALPSSVTSDAMGNLPTGVADVKFVGGELYALMGGSGCSHGFHNVDNALLRVNWDGTTTQVADLSTFQHQHPVAKPDLDDFEPDGTWYSMAAVGTDLYAVEPNHQEVDRISTTSGDVTRVADMSPMAADWIGPTTIVYHGGSFYIGTLSTFPVVPGSAFVLQMTPQGNVKTLAKGLTTVLGLAFDSHGSLYALESMTEPGFPGPAEVGAGKVVRVNPDGSLDTVLTGLSFPSAMAFGPDGLLYVSDFGFGAPGGRIVRADVSGAQVPHAVPQVSTPVITPPSTGDGGLLQGVTGEADLPRREN